MMSSMRTPIALYRALQAAKVPDDLAKEAADATAEDMNALIAQLVTKQDLAVTNARIDALAKTVEVQFDSMNKVIESMNKVIESKFKVVNIYLLVVGVLAGSSSPIFASLVHAIGTLLH
ncbi:hypothetical protein HAP94_10840 [Acidithiobacillus ferrivorans]|nr:hypothetical protein [Acidithiobacillus ferrivorans]